MSRKKRTAMQNVVEQPKRPDNLGLRLPPGMKEEMRAIAAGERRTLTSWVENVLAEAIERAKKRKAN